MATVILFDVMDTLVEDPFFHGLQEFFGLTFRELRRAVTPGSWVRFERGEIDEETYLAQMFRDGRPVDREGLHRRLRQGYRFMPGMDALLDELHAAGVPMHALSNYPSWYLLVERELGLSRRVPWTFVSYETGRRKPDREAYLEAARELGLPLSACLLVDDRPENCDAARATGMQAIVFRGASPTRDRLLERGLLRHRGGKR